MREAARERAGEGIVKRRVRVLVVDDSPLCVDVIARCIATDSRLEVIGRAYDGLRAVELASRLRPSVITMDLHMPRLDGLAAIQRIMRESPTRILVVTSVDDRGSAAFDALRRGACNLMEKPRIGEGCEALCARIWALARAPWSAPEPRRPPPPVRAPREAPVSAVGLVASTGGPAALSAILRRLPADFPAPILMVQHLPIGFAPRLARWLDAATPLSVALAQDGERLRPGRVLLAPDERHLAVEKSMVRLECGPPLSGHRPSGTRLLESLARAFGSSAAGLVLTGMGRDGVDGLAALRQAGGKTAAQDESSSIVFGMPRVALETGAANHALHIDSVAEQLVAWAERRAA